MKILVFPKDKNPYQEQLYKNMPTGVEVAYIETKTDNRIAALLSYVLQLVEFRFKGFRILHLHWLYSFSLSSPNKMIDWVFKHFVAVYIVSFLLLAKLFGYKVVWTIHNIVPHERLTDNDELLTKTICALSDSVVVLSQDTIDQMKMLKISSAKTTIIPLGNYIDLYENTITHHSARTKLRVPQDAFVFLFIGLIRKYKGIENLEKAFATIIKSNPSSMLVIAGECNDEKIKEQLVQFQKNNAESVKLLLQNIPDNDLQLYLNAANVVTLPFIKVTNSSSILLAMSFAKPVIYPLLGNMKELPENVGISYDLDDKDGLVNAMQQATKNRKELEEFGKNGLSFAKTLSWDKIGGMHYEVYRSILGQNNGQSQGF